MTDMNSAEMMREATRKLDQIGEQYGKKANSLEARCKEIESNLGELEQHVARLPEGGVSHATKNGVDQTPLVWHDTKTNQPVQVYSPQQAYSQGRDPNAPSVGEVIRAKITGKGTTEVRNALSEGTDASGGYLVPAPLSRDMIDLMRQKNRVTQAGARLINLDTETLSIAGIAADPTPTWREENAEITESQPVFNRLDFKARWLGVLVPTSRELIEDSPNAGEAIQNSIAAALATEWDRAAMFGSGQSPEPLGLTNTAGVFDVSMGGSPITGYGPLLQAVNQTTSANADMPTAMIMAPRTKYLSLGGLVDADGQPLNAPSVLQSIPQLDTTGVPVDEGTDSDETRIVVGDFKQLYIGVRSELRIEVNPNIYAKNHQFAIIAWIRTDIQVAQPKAFCQISGIAPTALAG